MMNEEQLQTFCILPSFAPFVGREREVDTILEFLQEDHAHSILLIYGPRGIGKSALAREAARKAYETKLFKTVFWLDRRRIEKIIATNPSDQIFLHGYTGLSAKDFTLQEILKIIDDSLLNRWDSEIIITPKTIDVLKYLLDNTPYLLIIDDFDEYCTLREMPELCEQLEHAKTPNKILLTSRLTIHKFNPSRSHRTLPVGLLEQTQIKTLIFESYVHRLERHQWVQGDSEATAEYLSRISGGLPEFVTHFLLPFVEQKRQILYEGKNWSDAYLHFAAGYLVGRYQERVWEKYRENYESNVQAFKTNIGDKLTDFERYVLFTLSQTTNNLPQTLDDLARSIGLEYDSEEKEKVDVFIPCLQKLHEMRLIFRVFSQNKSSSATKTSSPLLLKTNPIEERWQIPSFLKEFLHKYLVDNSEIEYKLYCEQHGHWIQYVEKNLRFPERIVHQFEQVKRSFQWSYEAEEWQRVIQLGELLSEASQNRTGFSELTADLLAIRRKIADAANKSTEVSTHLYTAIRQWLWLAQHYIAENTPESNALALENVNHIFQIWEQSEEYQQNETFFAIKWAEATCIAAEVNLRRGDLKKAIQLVDEIEKRELHTRAEWAGIAYKLAEQLRHSQELSRLVWDLLQRALHSAIACKNLLIAAQIEVGLAYQYAAEQVWQKSSEYARSARARIDEMLTPGYKQNQQQVAITIYELLIRATTLEAQSAYYLGQIETSIDLLESALKLAKTEELTPIVSILYDSLIFVRIQSRGFNPAGELSKALGVKLFWGVVENQEQCTFCRIVLTAEDLAERNYWLCPNCKTPYHRKCIEEYGEGKCGVCQHVVSLD